MLGTDWPEGVAVRCDKAGAAVTFPSLWSSYYSQSPLRLPCARPRLAHSRYGRPV